MSAHTVDGVITARVVRTERHPGRGQGPPRLRRRRRWPRTARVVRRVQHAGRRHRAAGHARHGDARRTRDRAQADPRHPERRHAVLGARARSRRRSRRHRHPSAVGTPLGLPVRRSARPDRARPSTTSTSPATCPDCFGHLGRRPPGGRAPERRTDRSRPRTVARTAGAPTRQATVELVDGDRCARFTSTVISGVHVGPSPDWMARRLDRRRHALDQQRRRRQQLRDARAQPAEPRLRPRPLGRRRFRVRRATDGETMVTLDERRAHAHRPTTC